MPDLVEVVVEDARWNDFNITALAGSACGAVLRHLGLDPAGFEIALLACDDRRIAALNRAFRGKDAATNVLSWPASDLAAPHAGAAPSPPPIGADTRPAALGDIAISYERCAREAREQDRPMAPHVSHLLVHGCLHLLGYDHVYDKDAALMEGLEVEILANLGIGNPY